MSEEEGQNNNVALSAVDLVNKTNEATEKLKAENDRREELLEKQASLKLQNTLDGKANTGVEQKEETAEEYKDKIMRGEE